MPPASETMNIPTAMMLPERRLEGSLIGGTGPMKRMLQFAAVCTANSYENVAFASLDPAIVVARRFPMLSGPQVLPQD
jgi:hypothetical protein